MKHYCFLVPKPKYGKRSRANNNLMTFQIVKSKSIQCARRELAVMIGQGNVPDGTKYLYSCDIDGKIYR
jgi:hypothetical protein